jgi:hypothetical protein
MKEGGLGIRGIYVNSFIVDEGVSRKKKSFIRLRVDLFQLDIVRLIWDLCIYFWC